MKRQTKYRAVKGEIDGSILTRFWLKIDQDGPIQDHCPELGGCWVWTDAPTQYGYGRLRIAGRDVFAHRVSWDVHFGPIPDGLWVLHKCDNRICVRPDHLFLGDALANAADMVLKGRQVKGERHHFHLRPDSRPTGDRNGTRTHPEKRQSGDAHWTRRFPDRVVGRPGETHHAARLTESSVREIRSDYASGGVSLTSLASKFGVSFQHIGDIVRRKKWKHVI